jgi:hypothetical protein
MRSRGLDAPDMRFRQAFAVVLLSLARVDVQCSAGYYGSVSSVNVARGRPVSTSSIHTSSSYAPSLATDGAAGTAWHSRTKLQEWLGVNLGSSISIGSIRFYGMYGYYDDTYDFRVGPSSNFISNPTCASPVIYNTQNAYTDVTCIATGQYVSVHRRISGNMGVSELEVYGSGPCVACDAGKYSTATGATTASVCVACPANSQPSSPSGPCLCNAGMYDSRGAFPVGIQRSYPISSISNLRCTVCYDEPYSHFTTFSNIESCKTSAGSSRWILMGSKQITTSTSFSLLAAIKGSNFSTSTSKTEAYLSNGAYWYYKTGSSVGFAPTSTILLESPDVSNWVTNCADRLSWEVSGAFGGWRSGCTLDLETNTVWRKIMYSCSGDEQTCTACPAGKSSPAGSDALDDCV